MKRNKPFKIDLGFGNLMGESTNRTTKRNAPVLPTYSGEKYAVWTNRNGTIIKHTFRGSDKARAFLETARASGSYDTVSNVQFDF